MRIIMTYGLMTVLIALTPSGARGLDCPKEAAAGPTELIQFLKADVSKSDPSCVTQAIIRLGDSRSPAGTDALIAMLGFQRSQSLTEKYYLADLHDKFPAVPALFSIGMPAVPALLARLQSENVPGIVRSNAIRTVTTIYRDNPPGAIQAFMKAAAAAKSPADAERLRSCARDAVALCRESWRTRCSDEIQ